MGRPPGLLFESQPVLKLSSSESKEPLQNPHRPVGRVVVGEQESQFAGLCLQAGYGLGHKARRFRIVTIVNWLVLNLRN